MAPTTSTIDFNRVLAGELLRDERERGAFAALPMPSARFSAPGDDEVPARGLRVHHQVVDDLHADGARRLVAEGAEVVQIEVAVDRHVHSRAARRGGGQLVGAEGGVVAADGDELVHAQALERWPA